MRFSCSSTPQSGQAALQFASGLLQCLAKGRTSWHVNYDVAHNRTFGPCAPVPCIPVLRETPGLVGCTRPTRSRRVSIVQLCPRGKPVCLHLGYTSTVDKVFYVPDRPPRSSTLVDRAPPQDHMVAVGCPLGEKITSRSSDLSSHTKMRHQHRTESHCGRCSTTGSFASFPNSRAHLALVRIKSPISACKFSEVPARWADHFVFSSPVPPTPSTFMTGA